MKDEKTAPTTVTQNTFQGISGVKFLIAGASFVILVSGLKAAQAILIPFMFAFFLALLASGPIYWLKRKKVPSWIAVLIVTFFIIALFVFVATLLVNSVNQFSERLPHYSQNLNQLNSDLAAYFKKYNFDSTQIFGSINLNDYMTIFTKTLKGTVQAVSSFVVIIIMMIFMTLEAASFRSKVKVALKDKVDMLRFDGIAMDVQKYLVIKTFMSFVTGVLVGLWTWIIGLDFPLLWAMVAFILNYIPFIGSIVAAIPAIIFASLQLDLASAITLTIGYLVINIGLSNFVEPFLMGKRLGLSVLIVFLSLMFWGWVWGPAGALMSVPLTMIVKILFEHSSELHWVGVMMGNTSKIKN